MATSQGVDFCLSTTNVTHTSPNDPDNNAGNTGGNTAEYPRTTPQGTNVGFLGGISGSGGLILRDRSPTIDHRICGFAGPTGTSTGGVVDFQFDLSTMGGAGTYNIWIGAGDNNYAAPCKVEVFESNGTTSKGVLINGNTGSPGNFFDAAGNIWSAANWPANGSEDQGTNKAVITFSSTVAIFRIGDGAGNGVISHIFMTFVPGVIPQGWTINNDNYQRGIQQIIAY